MKPCPCGGTGYAACCGRYHEGMPAPDAQSLMEPLINKLTSPLSNQKTAAKCLVISTHPNRQTTPANALVMMRSRYSAYVLELEPYLLATWHPDSRPASIGFAKGAKWLGLEIRRFEETKDEAIVEFVARCRIGGKAERMHEISRFTLVDGNWLYVDGEFPD